MSLLLMIGLIGLLYILVFGGISLLRREGLSTRFAIEAVSLTAVTTAIVALTPIQINPFFFFIVLYLFTQRVRLLVDLANIFAERGRYAQAEKIYTLASNAWPDATSKLIVDVNRAVMLLQTDRIEDSIKLFTEVLEQANMGYLGVKYEAAAHFNLGVAYQHQHNNSMATVEFNSAIDTWPGSLYSRRAQQALDRQQKSSSPVEDKTIGS